jgi:AraC-like DNA-binding protein
MSIINYPPADHLKNYVDAWWIRKTEPAPDTSGIGRRIYADGSTDIILNTGDSTVYFNPMALADQNIPMYPGHMYLGGTMTAYGVMTGDSSCSLTGIRFRPGGFYALFGNPIEEAVDRVIDYPDKELQPLMQEEEGLADRLDAFFSAKKMNTRHDFTSIYHSIISSKGQVTVEELSRNAHVSNRTMERIFKTNVGIPPKEFIRIARFQEVLKRLTQTGVTEESLLRIAFEFGYYDHAHLTNEFKKYAGILPSELSHFYKTGIARGQYF